MAPSCDSAFVTREVIDGKLIETYGNKGTALFEVHVASPTQTPPEQVIADRGLCTLQPTPTAPNIAADVGSADVGMGFPTPLLFVGVVALVASGLNAVKKRKYSRDFQQQKESAYMVEYRSNADNKSDYQQPDLSCPKIDDDGLPTWEDGWPKLVETLPVSRRSDPLPWEGVQPPWYTADTLVTPMSTPSGTTSATPSDTVSDTPQIDPLSLCPFDIKNAPCEGEKRAVEWLIYLNESQNKIIRTVWGLAKNGREGSPYQLARARFQGYLEAFEEKYAVNR